MGNHGEGTVLVPADVQNRIIMRKPAPLSIAGRVTQLTTNRDTVVLPRLPYETDDLYTSPVRFKWVGEQPASATTHRVTDPGFGTFSIPIYNAMMSMALTSSVIEDEGFGLLAYVERLFSESVDVGTEQVVLNGTGQGQPAGILANPGGTNQPSIIKTGYAATLGSSATDLATTLQTLNKIAFDIAPQYDDASAWYMNKKSTALTLANLVDSTGRPVWGAGVQEAGLEQGYKGRPLIGYPAITTPFMDNIGANKFPMIFGDLSGYFKVNRVGFSIRVLNELYAETDQVLLLGRIRFGGTVAEPWRLRAIKCSA